MIFERINKVGTKIALEQKEENWDKVMTYGLEFLTLLDSSIKPPHGIGSISVAESPPFYGQVEGDEGVQPSRLG